MDSLPELVGSLELFVFSVGIYCGYVCADCGYLRVHWVCVGICVFIVGIGVITGDICVFTEGIGVFTVGICMFTDGIGVFTVGMCVFTEGIDVFTLGICMFNEGIGVYLCVH